MNNSQLTTQNSKQFKLKTESRKLKTILAIDPGYGKCGWAVLAQDLNNEVRIKNNVNNKRIIHHSPFIIQLMACDCIETDKKKNLPDRLLEIYQAIVYLVNKYQPTELAIEELFFFKNQKTVMAVAQARGAIIIAAKNLGLEIYQYTPLQVKQAIVGYGRGDKGQVQRMLKIHLSGQNTPVQDDTADAVAVGLTHLQTCKFNKYECSVF